jgi:hypothetical protein
MRGFDEHTITRAVTERSGLKPIRVPAEEAPHA